MPDAYKIMQDAGVRVKWRLTRRPALSLDSLTGAEVPYFHVLLEEKRFLPIAPGARARKTQWVTVLDATVTEKMYPDFMTELRLKHPLSGQLLVREVVAT